MWIIHDAVWSALKISNKRTGYIVLMHVDSIGMPHSFERFKYSFQTCLAVTPPSVGSLQNDAEA